MRVRCVTCDKTWDMDMNPSYKDGKAYLHYEVQEYGE